VYNPAHVRARAHTHTHLIFVLTLLPLKTSATTFRKFIKAITAVKKS